MGKRVFIIVLDSLGIGQMSDAHEFGDEGSNTLLGISSSRFFNCPNLRNFGLFNIDGVKDVFHGKYLVSNPIAAYGRLSQKSRGKDTTVGHWEIAGIVSPEPMPTYPGGFPDEIINKFINKTGKDILCNRVYSGTKVIEDYGLEHIKTKSLIVYTSADSVFQIAAHEDIIPPEELYGYCEKARRILKGEHAVGRVIARPFTGQPGSFERTKNRKDFSLEPPRKTMLDYIYESGLQVISLGKIKDIFAGRGITRAVKTGHNQQGVEKLIEEMKKDFEGLCFLNLVDFDMLYGHRNDVDGYAKALYEFDKSLPWIISFLRQEDILIMCADHGCDPSTESTDHSREYVPLLVYGDNITPANLGTGESFANIAASVLEYLEVDGKTDGKSFVNVIIKK